MNKESNTITYYSNHPKRFSWGRIFWIIPPIIIAVIFIIDMSDWSQNQQFVVFAIFFSLFAVSGLTGFILMAYKYEWMFNHTRGYVYIKRGPLLFPLRFTEIHKTEIQNVDLDIWYGAWFKGCSVIIETNKKRHTFPVNDREIAKEIVGRIRGLAGLSRESNGLITKPSS